MKSNFSKVVAYRALNLLDERKARLYPDRKAFYVWPLIDRLLLIFDPAVVDGRKVNEDLAHGLSTRLQGRIVVRTNSRGLYFQIGYDIPPAPVELTHMPLDLSRQPTPFHMPIGITQNGEIWKSLIEGDSFFVVGVRNMGKSAELHGFIQALLHGGQTLVHAWDGKSNAEYLRYMGQDNFTLIPMNGLQSDLQAIQQEVTMRMRKLAMSGHPNTISFNLTAKPDDFMKPIALVIDEVAEVDDQELLVRHVKVNRAAGVFPIFATNDPTKAAVVAKSNLGTRISFAVISSSDSIMGFGRPGANKLPKVQGRGLIEQDGRLVEFQAFTVEYPKPTEAGLRWMNEHAEAAVNEPTASNEVDPDLVRELYQEGNTVTAIVRKIGDGVTGGNRYMRLKKLVEAAITTTTTASTDHNLPVLAAERALRGGSGSGLEGAMA